MTCLLRILIAMLLGSLFTFQWGGISLQSQEGTEIVTYIIIAAMHVRSLGLETRIEMLEMKIKK